MMIKIDSKKKLFSTFYQNGYFSSCNYRFEKTIDTTIRIRYNKNMAKYYDVDNETPFVKAEEDFYHYNQGSPYGKIPMERIEAKISALTAEKDYEEVLRVLSYWQEEAYALGDYYGERVISTIASGYNILIGNYEKALSYAEKNLLVCEKSDAEKTELDAENYFNAGVASRELGFVEKSKKYLNSCADIYSGLATTAKEDSVKKIFSDRARLARNL